LATEDEIHGLKTRHAAQLMARPGVSGVGVERDGQGGYVLTVHLESADPSLAAGLPAEIEGHAIRYCPSGPYRKLPAIGGDDGGK
jgi:hypothetical protein